MRASAEELIEEQVPEGELLACDVQALERLGIHARARVRHGLVVDEILAEAEGGDYDLVAIGAYRAEGWQRILLSDLAHKIMVQLDRPVLAARGGSGESTQTVTPGRNVERRAKLTRRWTVQDAYLSTCGHLCAVQVQERGTSW